MTIARVALPVALDRSFDYWAPDGLALSRGSIVRVRLARRPMVGAVVEIVSEANVDRDSLQPIDEVAPLPPLQSDVLALCDFVASYYQQPRGMALALAVPPLGSRPALRGREQNATGGSSATRTTLNPDQQTAADAICNAEGTFAPFLLQGVTGSGKTDVFLAAANTMIQHGPQVLMLVPEIKLTPQL